MAFCGFLFFPGHLGRLEPQGECGPRTQCTHASLSIQYPIVCNKYSTGGPCWLFLVNGIKTTSSIMTLFFTEVTRYALSGSGECSANSLAGSWGSLSLESPIEMMGRNHTGTLVHVTYFRTTIELMG